MTAYRTSQTDATLVRIPPRSLSRCPAGAAARDAVCVLPPLHPRRRALAAAAYHQHRPDRAGRSGAVRLRGCAGGSDECGRSRRVHGPGRAAAGLDGGAGIGRTAQLGAAEFAGAAPDPARQLPDADPLERASLPAAAVDGLFPGRIRRAHRHQADADLAGGARDRGQAARHRQLRAGVFRRHPDRGGQRGLATDAAVRGLVGLLRAADALVRAADGQGLAATGRRAFRHDRAHRRQLHQHRHGQAVLAFAARAGLRTGGDGRFPADRLPADAPGHHRARRAVHAGHGAAGGGGRARHLAVAARPRQRGRGRGSLCAGAAPARHVALDHVGTLRAVREHRHRARRHQFDLAPADGGRCARRARAAAGTRRRALRRRGLPLRQGQRGDRAPRPAHRARREDRRGRPQRRRQVDAGEPAAALPRRRSGPHRHRRHRRGRRAAGLVARADRRGDPGHLAAASLGAREHPVRTPRRDGR